MMTYNSRNDIAAIGYSTGEAFMTVHANNSGIYTVNTVPGTMIRESATGYNKIKRVENIPTDPLMSVSVYRSDISAGNTHVSMGMIRNVFIPVSVRGESIHRENFAFVFYDEIIKTNTFYVKMERMQNIKNLNDIKRVNFDIGFMARNDNGSPDIGYTRTELKIGNKTFIIFADGSARADITWQTATGRRIIACAEKFARCDLTKHLGLPMKKDEQILPEHHFRKVFNGGKWYDFIYVADKVVMTNEYEPDIIYDINGEECFILSKIDQKTGGTIMVKFPVNNNQCTDYYVDKKTSMDINFDPVEYVKNSTHTGYIGTGITRV